MRNNKSSLLGLIQGREKVVRASLSEPHTSVPALSTCIYLRLFEPTIYRKFQMSTFKYFMKIDIVCMKNVKASGGQRLLSVQRQGPEAKITEVGACRVACVLLIVFFISYPQL